MDRPAEQDPRIYLAAERTFLAWLRTGLGLIGVGFAVSRFGIFMRELSATTPGMPQPTGLSAWSGVALVVLGVIVNVTSVARHVQLIRELREGTWIPGRVSTEAIILGVLLALMGVVMAVYLVLIH